MSKRDSIIIHHSATKDTGTVSWGAIRKYHVETCGWRDIGYNYGIELVGDDYEILVGRFEDEIGAHTKGWNQRSIGICMVGDFDTSPPPIKQINLTVELVQYLMRTYDIKAYGVKGHREADRRGVYPQKSCPGKLFDMEKFRERIG